MKKLIGVMLTLVIVLGMVSSSAATSRTEEVERLNYILEKAMKYAPGTCPEYSGVEYFADIEVMLVSVSYYNMPYLSPDEVRDRADMFYELFATTTESLAAFTDCDISLLVKELNNQLWIIDKNGIYDCTVGEVVDQRVVAK